MIVVAYQRTMAGAAQRAALRGRVLGEAPKPLPKPVVAPVAVLLSYTPPVKPTPLVAWEKPEKPRYIAVEPVPYRLPRIMIAKVMAWHDGMTVEHIMGSSRARVVVAARFDAIAAVHENCRLADGRRYSLPELGRMFDRDHTSILHALRARGIDRSPQPGDGTNS